MIKGTVLYGHPKDAVAFEKYYTEAHQPLVSKTSGILKAEYTNFCLTRMALPRHIIAWQNYILKVRLTCSRH